MHKRFRAVEVATTSAALWWGLILLAPFDTFHTSSAYGAMERLAPELVWGVFMLSLGVMQLLSMILSNYRLKRSSLLIATGIWFFIASMFSFGTFFTTATGTYAIFGSLTAWLYMKVGEQQNGRYYG